MMHTYFMYLLLILCGLTLGSFLNVVIYRIPLILHREWRNDCRSFLTVPIELEEKINLFLPRSFCRSCKKTILATQNIPILSYLLLRGRCKNCKQPISIRYPFVEALSTLLVLFSAWHFGFNFTFLTSVVCIGFLIALFFIDLEHQLLPDNLTLTLLWFGLIVNTQFLFTSLSDAVLSAAIAYSALWLFIKIFYLITGKIGMGNGDFKLLAALGAWFGGAQLLLILLIASILGIIIGLSYLYIQQKEKDTPIPFGPFLCLAGIISLFWGKPMIDSLMQILT